MLQNDENLNKISILDKIWLREANARTSPFGITQGDHLDESNF